MNRFNLLVAAFALLLSIPTYAQISQGGMPIGQQQTTSMEQVPVISLTSFDLKTVMLEDEQEEKMGNYPKIGRILPVNAPAESSGIWTRVADGYLWRVALKSRGALGTAVHFKNFVLPEGAQLFIHSPDYKHVIGAFTNENNHESGIFSTELLPSDEVIVEYFSPTYNGATPFEISGLLHAYRMVPGAEAEHQDRDFGDSDNCQVNINCSEGNDWQNEKRGVVRILVIEGQFAGWCTGSLVNNTAQDCTPYLLTALHCGENASTSNMNQWVFYFNYESSGCGNGSQGQVPNNSMSGCSRIADSNDGGGDTGSDYMLVSINNNVPSSYNPYYNGWSRSTSSSSSGVSIHHPSGDIKKISTYTSSLQSASWGGSASGTHWYVTWSSTANGHGVTEGGSSGSPIFNNQGLIIGTLTGGSSYCSATNNPDMYGKMSYHWGSNPGDDLSDYLDPGNTGVMTLSGSNNPCASGGCAADIPYPESDPCVQTVIADNPACCNVAWDGSCQDAYDACNDTGGECEAGSISSSLTQNVCPGETGAFNATGASFPDGGGYAIGFTPNGGSGGPDAGFSLTGVPLPYTFDAGLNGVLAANSLPNLSGQWVLTGFAYTDENDVGNSICGQTSTSITVNFLASNDPACDGGDCLTWVNPSPDGGWTNFSDLGGAPTVADGCPFVEISNIEVWQSEAYEIENIVAGTSYTFSHCNGAGAGSWVPEYVIVAPSGAVDANGLGDGDGCSITWTATESGTYLVGINNAAECGVAADVDNGYPAITCNEVSTGVEDIEETAFTLFPNPNNGSFYINYGGEAGYVSVEILELSGKVILSEGFNVQRGEQIPVDLANQSAGMYFVRLTVDNTVNIEKVMVE